MNYPATHGGRTENKLLPVIFADVTRAAVYAREFTFALITSSCDEYFAPPGGAAQMFRKYLPRRLLNARVRARGVSAE